MTFSLECQSKSPHFMKGFHEMMIERNKAKEDKAKFNGIASALVVK